MLCQCKLSSALLPGISAYGSNWNEWQKRLFTKLTPVKTSINVYVKCAFFYAPYKHFRSAPKLVRFLCSSCDAESTDVNAQIDLFRGIEQCVKWPSG